MKRLTTLLLSVVVLTVSQQSFASEDAVPALTEYFSNEIASVDSKVELMPDSEPMAAEVYDEAWFFRRIWLRLRAQFGIDVPVVKLVIIPEIEMLLEREYPEGWTTYAPVKK